MFEKGEYIIYGTKGVCKVADITTIDMEGATKDRLYYVLEPLGVSGSKVFTPVGNTKIIMRRILTKEEALHLIDGITNIGQLGVANDKQREEKYKEALKSCDCTEWVKVIKSLYLRKQERVSQGKKLTSMDERYLKTAEDTLFSELSIPLDISKEEMENFITDKIEEKVECTKI